jgi:hypothetical protein
MPRRKEPGIPDAVLDPLLAGADPKTAFDPKARFSEVGWAGDNEFLALTAAAGDAEHAQLSCTIDTGEVRWGRRHAAWWPA